MDTNFNYVGINDVLITCSKHVYSANLHVRLNFLSYFHLLYCSYNIFNIQNGIINGITKLCVMTQVLARFYRYLQLSIADLILSDILTHLIHQALLKIEPLPDALLIRT